VTKDKILQAAIHQYSLHGYQGATMDKIASEVGIKPASIYFFFKNKKVLFTEAFEKVLGDHLAQMKTIFYEVQDKPVEEIFSSLLHGTVDHHTTHAKETNAYISLVTSTPLEVKPFLHSFMEGFDAWLIESLISLLKRDRPGITDKQATVVTRQFILLLDAVFWEMNLYEEEKLKEQISHALDMINMILGGFTDEK